MMTESAMSSLWDCEWEPLYDFKSNEWLPLEDEIREKKVNDPSLNLTKCETAEQILHGIEELGRKEESYLLEEYRLFEEIQSLGSFDEAKSQCGQKFEEVTVGRGEESSKDGSVVQEFHPQVASIEDLLSASYENSATFIHSGENIVYVDSVPYVEEAVPESKVKDSESEEEAEGVGSLQQEAPELDEKMVMAVVEEIVRNSAMELDQWESDSTQSETSSDSLTGSEASPKGREEENEDPDWKPESWKSSGGRSKPYWRGGSTEDKRMRKKEQNKNAATRYRQKKKAEKWEILKEEETLKEKKVELEKQVADLQKEISLVKGLMRDVFAAKGFIN